MAADSYQLDGAFGDAYAFEKFEIFIAAYTLTGFVFPPI